MPVFDSAVTEAFAEMTSLESPHDFFVSGFVEGTEKLELRAKGKGGLAKVKEVLTQDFENEVAVAMFRLTAVDDRGKVKSFRTKLVHVVYIGPKTPVMKRAKVGPWNSALKQPFTMNLSIQTDDVDSDLSEVALERSLRASGGAHQPTYFDFTNSEGGGGASVNSPMYLPSPKSSPIPESPSAVPRSPSGTRSYVTAWNEHNRAFHDRDIELLRRQYAEDYCKLVFTDAVTGSVVVSEGIDDIAATMELIFGQYQDEFEIIKVEKTQPDVGHTSEGIVFCYWKSEGGSVSGFDTICFVGGKAVLHTLVITRIVDPQQEILEVASQATAEFDDTTAASNQADAGDLPSQEATSEAPDIISQGVSEDEFVEVDQPPLSVGESTSYEGQDPQSEPAEGDSTDDVQHTDAKEESLDVGEATEYPDDNGENEDVSPQEHESAEEHEGHDEEISETVDNAQDEHHQQ